MGAGGQFDRRIFAGRSETPQRSPSPVRPAAGLLLVAAALGVGVFVVYKLAKTDGTPDVGRGNPELAQIEEKLKELNQRLDRIEKRRKTATEESAASPTEKEVTASPHAHPSSPPVRTVYRISPPPPAPLHPAAAASPPPDNRLSDQQQELSSLRSDVTATHEEWQATSDRLASAVGELGSQRSEIARNREGLSQVLEQLRRTPIRFDLRKEASRQQVGPVWLRLQSTDPKNQRYTLRIFVDDKWVVMKGRSLNEAVNFYMSNLAVPVELVVSQIGRDRVAGKLMLPQPAVGR